ASLARLVSARASVVRCRSGFAAWLPPRLRRSGRGCSSAAPGRSLPGANRPRGPGRWLQVCGRGVRLPSSPPPACVTHRRPAAGAARRRTDRLARWPTGCASPQSRVALQGEKDPTAHSFPSSVRELGNLTVPGTSYRLSRQLILGTRETANEY